MILTETYTLSNGVPIPKLGLGTWFIDDDKAAQAVRDAVEIGYRNIDTAQAYGNERGVGEGVRTSGVPRESCSSPPSWPPRSRTTTTRSPRSTGRWRRSGWTTST